MIMGLSSMIRGTTPDKGPEGIDLDETDVLDDEPRNILLALISQLRIGMDLSKVTLPVFILEPRSMLERVTDFLSHPALLFGSGALEDPEERFIQVMRYYLAGWHIKPKGVKKPYNPVLGEIFRCRYDYPDGTVGYFVAEQVSHHPPISAWYFSSPENKLEICGELRPKSRFLGNSAATIMEGASYAMFLDRPEDGEYHITMPNMYARGILFGKMILELGDTSTVKNVANGLSCDIEFKTKGFFSGTYNAIAGKVTGRQGEIGEISGKWNEVMEIRRNNSRNKEILFDAASEAVTPKSVTPEDQQLPNESRRLWSAVTEAIKKKDLDAATEAKSAIEDAARESTKEREENGVAWVPKFFSLQKGEFRQSFKLPQGTPQEQVKAVEEYIYGSDPRPPLSTTNSPISATPSPI